MSFVGSVYRSTAACHEVHEGDAGCDDQDCCVAVCEVHPECCVDTVLSGGPGWSQKCVDAAFNKAQCQVRYSTCDTAKSLNVDEQGNPRTLDISEFFTNWGEDASVPETPFLCGLSGSTVWYKWTNEGSDDVKVNINTCDDCTFDTTIALFGACPQFRSERDQLLACVNESPFCGSGLGGSKLETTVAAGDTIFIQVGGFFGAQGSATLKIEEVP